jgi:hypothetical protein
VRFVVDEVALGQAFFIALRFPTAGTVGKTVADVPSGIRLTPPQETKKKKSSKMQKKKSFGNSKN